MKNCRSVMVVMDLYHTFRIVQPTVSIHMVIVTLDAIQLVGTACHIQFDYTFFFKSDDLIYFPTYSRRIICSTNTNNCDSIRVQQNIQFKRIQTEYKL